MISTCLAKIWHLGSRPIGDLAWEGIVRLRHAMATGAAVVSSLLLTAACSSSSSNSSSGTSTSSGSAVNWATVSSASAGGGMSALVAAAEKEGQLNVITLPSNWANYGNIMKDFSAKYHIHITDANPDGSSQDELNAINQTKGQSRAPDVVDVGTAFAALLCFSKSNLQVSLP
jgi:putative spermidine/putrescine transport system substrate-binding protein